VCSTHSTKAYAIMAIESAGLSPDCRDSYLLKDSATTDSCFSLCQLLSHQYGRKGQLSGFDILYHYLSWNVGSLLFSSTVDLPAL